MLQTPSLAGRGAGSLHEEEKMVAWDAVLNQVAQYHLRILASEAYQRSCSSCLPYFFSIPCLSTGLSMARGTQSTDDTQGVWPCKLPIDSLPLQLLAKSPELMSGLSKQPRQNLPSTVAG